VDSAGIRAAIEDTISTLAKKQARIPINPEFISSIKP